MKKRFALLLAAVLTMGATLSACGSKDNAGGEKTDAPQVLNLPIGAEIPSMDSSKATDAESFMIMINTNEGLYRLGEDGKTPTLGMAKEDPTVSEDKLTYTFKLREDAKWSNGEPVTANDFVYAWQRAVNPDTASEYAYIMFDVKNAAAVNEGKMPVDQLGIKALDEYTLEVQLENAIPYFIELTAFPTFFPQNQKWVEAQAGKYGTEANNVLYNGPFVMSEWKHNESIKLTKNDNYWDKDAVKLEEINFKVLKETSTTVNLYDGGEIDRAGLTSEFVDQYKDGEGFGTISDASTFFIRLNQKNEALANVNIRRAIVQAINKENLTNELLNNGSKPINGLVPSNFTKNPENGGDFREDVGELLPYNVAEAQKAWTQGLKELGTDKVTLTLTNSDSDLAKRIAEYIQGELQTNLPGLTVNVKLLPFKQQLDENAKGNYDMSIGGWGADYPDPMTFLYMFVTDGGHNQTGYSSEQYDKLIKDGQTTYLLDTKKRWEVLIEAEKTLMNDAVIAPLYQRGRAYVQQPYVKGVVEHLFSGDMSFKWASIEK
ncbi:MAG: ABC transporter substrate-binding protein [Bacilli bacterium]